MEAPATGFRTGLGADAQDDVLLAVLEDAERAFGMAPQVEVVGRGAGLVKHGQRGHAVEPPVLDRIVRRAVVADPSLVPDAIEESLRFNTSAQRFRRCLTKDTELHGQTMREGDFVCLAYGSANRDERQFANPDVYDLARKPKGHVGFGGSVHACLGTAVARMSVKIAMEEFHKVVPDYVRVQEQLPWMPSSTFRSPLKLDLAVQ